MTMEPFDSTRNPIVSLREHARAIDAFDYDRLNYQYDNLNFHGLSIPELDEVLNKRKAEDRVFANFMLHVSRVSSLHGVACFVVIFVSTRQIRNKSKEKVNKYIQSFALQGARLIHTNTVTHLF